MRVCLLASGSRGNSALIEADGCRILVDAGLSGREIEKRLATLDLSGGDLHAILVSHEHHDHVGAVGPLARRFNLPVYIDSQTHAVLPRLGNIEQLQLFSAGDSFSCRGLMIDSFATTHDAVNPVGFVVSSGEGKVGFATDLGMSTRLVSEHLKDCRVLVLEANHDEQMLLDGPYPWALKQRIRSRHGHLSNHDTERLLRDVSWPGLEALFLAHLSEENNCPDLVAAKFQQLMHERGHKPQIVVGQQHQASSCFVGALL